MDNRLFDNAFNNIPPDAGDLPVNLLAAIFKDKNQSYKLFWFESLVDKVCEGKTVISYDELVNKVIAKAWYMVMEYRLNLGPKDAIEIAINQIRDTCHLSSNEKEEVILSYLENSNDKNIREAKRKLVQNVPYRLQSPFFEKVTAKEWGNYDIMAKKARLNERVLYYYELLNNQPHIRVNERWIGYIQKNEAILQGWTQNELIQYLQRRNPNVPGIPFKIAPPVKRDLKYAIDFWQTIIINYEIQDSYTGRILNKKNFEELGNMDIDHFIPWSYVTNDEMWNLTPTFSSINRSKNNLLPDRRADIEHLAAQHYKAYKIAESNTEILKLLKKLKEKHLNSDDIKINLYRTDIAEEEFQNRMYTIINPIYQSASNVGFENWINRIYL